MKKVAVIMAGGSGERFWPKSRRSKPKQFLSLTDDGETLIQKTVNRISDIIAYEDIFVVTNEIYYDLVKEQLKDISNDNIILEPASRNTAPCIAIAAELIRKRYGDAVMVVLPSDHTIRFNHMFTQTISSAADIAEHNPALVTIGITPSYPETGYGYINFEHKSSATGAYKVKRFVEKPCIELANEYFSSGEYLWNSGMFIWKASVIIDNIRTHLPDIGKGVAKIADAYQTDSFEDVLNEIYPKFKNESIDFGVMEKSENVYTVPGNFGWNDVGNWSAYESINKTNEYGNLIQGDVITIDTHNTIVCGNHKLIALVGIDNLVVVDTDDALLICAKDSTQNVKKVIENLKICNRTEMI